jgi:lipopolysaccharide biosynthesis glycosyltransferase
MTMKSPIHVACTFDGAMAIPALIVASSIKQTMTPGRKIIFHAVASETGLIPPEAALLNSDDFELRPTQISDRRLYRSNLSKSFVRSIANLARFELPELLPDVDRLIYLDCDVMVRSALDELFDTEMCGYALGACLDEIAETFDNLDYTIPLNDHIRRNFQRLNINVATYFNSGMLLMDCRRWRQHHYTMRLQSLLARHRMLYVGQDPLNILLGRSYKRIDGRWNTFAHLAKESEPPAIVHFTNIIKPWTATRIDYPYGREFWSVVENSPFAKLPMPYEPYILRDDFLSKPNPPTWKQVLDKFRVRSGFDRLLIRHPQRATR